MVLVSSVWLYIYECVILRNEEPSLGAMMRWDFELVCEVNICRLMVVSVIVCSLLLFSLLDVVLLYVNDFLVVGIVDFINY